MGGRRRQLVDADCGLFRAEIAGALVPFARFVAVGDLCPKVVAMQKCRIVAGAETQRAMRIAGLERTPVQKPRRGQVAMAEGAIAAQQQRPDFRRR